MISDIFNFYSYNDTLAADGQTTEAKISLFNEDGIELIVSISPASTRNYLPSKASLTEQLGMDYVHYLMDCSNLRSEHYSVFKAVLSELEGKKVFMHSGGNIKSSNLIYMYNVLEKGLNEKGIGKSS